MEKPNKNESWDRAMKQISKQIEGYGEIQANRQKIMAQIAVNEMEAKNNLFYKMQEKQMLDQNEQEKFQQMQNESAGAGAGVGGEEQNPIDVMTQPQIGMSASGKAVRKEASPLTKAVALVLLKKQKGKKLDASDEAILMHWGGMSKARVALDEEDNSWIGGESDMPTSTPSSMSDKDRVFIQQAIQNGYSEEEALSYLKSNSEG
jgi:hypothetical protein